MALLSELKTARAELAGIRQHFPGGDDADRAEWDKRIFQLWKEQFIKQLEELGISSLAAEALEILAGIGPRPFDSSHQSDQPYWVCLNELADRHPALSHRIRAADMLAWAALASTAGEDSAEWRAKAAKELEAEVMDKKTRCDVCGADLAEWSCLTYRQHKPLKVCRSCSSPAQIQHSSIRPGCT